MNTKDNFSIILREKLFCRSVYNSCRPDLAVSDTARGMYCASRLIGHDRRCMLCVLLDSRERYVFDTVLNRDACMTLQKLTDTVVSTADEFAAKKVLLATTLEDEDDFLSLASSAVVTGDRLSEHGISLVGYYLTNGMDYENVII